MNPRREVCGFNLCRLAPGESGSVEATLTVDFQPSRLVLNVSTGLVGVRCTILFGEREVDTREAGGAPAELFGITSTHRIEWPALAKGEKVTLHFKNGTGEAAIVAPCLMGHLL